MDNLKKREFLPGDRYHPLMNIFKGKIELVIHLIFWAFIVSAINVDWTANWFDSSIRPNTPAPLSVIAFALYFYVNTFLLLPVYFSLKTWKTYGALAFLLFVMPELLRVIIFKITISDISFEGLLISRDSFLFGTPSPFFIAINASFIYRLTKDKFFKKNHEDEFGEATKKITPPYEDTILLSDEEAHELELKLNHQLTTEEIYLDPELKLRDVAKAVESTEKKVSYLINQYLKSSFYELINRYRVEKFKTEIANPENENLSIVGVAFNCGFPSKSSFYRAFKSNVSMSPSEYLKTISQNQ